MPAPRWPTCYAGGLGYEPSRLSFLHMPRDRSGNVSAGDARVSAFDACFEFTVGREGGYVNDSRDPGGETNWGISRRAYPRIDIKALTRDDAKAIYERDYFKPAGCVQMSPAVALAVFDAAVNSGVRQAVRWLQLAVDAQPDGVIGPRTLAAVQKSDQAALVLELLEMRLAFMERLPQYATFGHGWRRRILGLAVQAARLT